MTVSFVTPNCKRRGRVKITVENKSSYLASFYCIIWPHLHCRPQANREPLLVLCFYANEMNVCVNGRVDNRVWCDNYLQNKCPFKPTCQKLRQKSALLYEKNTCFKVEPREECLPSCSMRRSWLYFYDLRNHGHPLEPLYFVLWV